MELSIIIPTIRIANIDPCIRSICTQDNLKFNFEILIINNSQNLEEKFNLLNEFKNFNIKYFHVKNQGSTEARHIGYIYSKSKILLNHPFNLKTKQNRKNLKSTLSFIFKYVKDNHYLYKSLLKN